MYIFINNVSYPVQILLLLLLLLLLLHLRPNEYVRSPCNMVYVSRADKASSLLCDDINQISNIVYEDHLEMVMV